MRFFNLDLKFREKPYAGDNTCNYIRIVNNAPVFKEVTMEKVYEYKNAVIYVRSLDTYDRENLKKATADFLKKVINGGNKIDNRNTSGAFCEKQILHR